MNVAQVFVSGFDVVRRKQLDSLCGPGRYIGGGFSHSSIYIGVQTYYVSGFRNLMQSKMIQVFFYDTGFPDTREGGWAYAGNYWMLKQP